MSNFMAYWYNLAWQVRERTWSIDGTSTGGLIERMENLAFSYELDHADVKTKAVAEVQRDIFGNIVTTGKKGKEKVKTVKQQYIVPVLKTQSITFRTVYQVATGTTDILGKIEEIKEMIGNSGPLIVGCEYIAKDTGEITNAPRIVGVYQMQLTKISVSDTEMDEIGRFIKATVSFTLTETTDPKVLKAAVAYPSEAAREVMQNWVKNGYVYTEVDAASITKKTNPKKLGWYEIVDGEYIATTDKKAVAGKTYYTRKVNEDTVPEEFWSALGVSPDPNVKALVKQKKADTKANTKAAKAALKEQVKDLQARIRAGETGL